MSLENIIALRNGNDEEIYTFHHFEEMYFQVVRQAVTTGATPVATFTQKSANIIEKR